MSLRLDHQMKSPVLGLHDSLCQFHKCRGWRLRLAKPDGRINVEQTGKNQLVVLECLGIVTKGFQQISCKVRNIGKRAVPKYQGNCPLGLFFLKRQAFADERRLSKPCRSGYFDTADRCQSRSELPERRDSEALYMCGRE